MEKRIRRFVCLFPSFAGTVRLLIRVPMNDGDGMVPESSPNE